MIEAMKQANIRAAPMLAGAFLSVLVAMPAFANSNYEYARIKSFDAFPASGPLVPSGGLIEGRDGALYGVTVAGGTFNLGAAFVLNKDGTGCRVLHSFGDVLHFGVDEGANPKAALLEGTDGDLYGTTASGGSYKQGTIFAISNDGSNYRLLHIFRGIGPFADGANPLAALIEGTDGALYGTTVAGGPVNQGTIFAITKDGGYRMLRAFTGSGGDGGSPQAALLEGNDGALYGTTVSGGGTLNRGTIFKIGKDGTDYTVLYRFSGGGKDGANPVASLIAGTDGAAYGTTASGGAGLGTVFQFKGDGSGVSLLHSFTGGRANPEAALVEAPDGALYGTTPFGGNSGWGAVFKVNKDSTGYQLVHSFTAAPGQGRVPRAPLLFAGDGALYGTTMEGGGANQGIVFRIRLRDSQSPTNDAAPIVQTEPAVQEPRDVKNVAAEEFTWTVPHPLPTSAPDKLVLKGISGAANRRFALVNNQTLATGDRAKVRVGTTNVVVDCVEIRDNSVVLRLEGEKEPQELTLLAK